MTEEEFIYELLLYKTYNETASKPPIDKELQAKIEAWSKGDTDALPIPEPSPADGEIEWEDVDPKTVVGGGS